MNVLVPIAGPDEAFREKGLGPSKNLAEVVRRPLVQHVYENLATIPDARFLFVVRREEVARFHLDEILRLLDPDCVVVVAEGPTAGAACTAILAVEHIRNDDPLIIANGDQILLTDLRAALDDFRSRDLDGGILTFDAVHPRWSYVRLDDRGLVVEAAEKRPISRHATAGFYYFRRGRDFVEAAMEMIRKDAHVGGGFYVCPAVNQMVLKQARVGVRRLPADAYHSLATPQGVHLYEDFLRSNPRAPMRRDRLDRMVRGWFVGAFEPTALKTEAAEVGVRLYKAGDAEGRHHHRVATEVTAIISGRVRMNDRTYEAGDIVVIGPSEATDFEALTDATTVVVKVPGALNDKYPGDAPQ